MLFYGCCHCSAQKISANFRLTLEWVSIMIRGSHLKVSPLFLLTAFSMSVTSFLKSIQTSLTLIFHFNSCPAPEGKSHGSLSRCALVPVTVELADCFFGHLNVLHIAHDSHYFSLTLGDLPKFASPCSSCWSGTKICSCSNGILFWEFLLSIFSSN